MNLTHLVKQPAVRARIDLDVPRPTMKVTADLLVPRTTKNDNPQLMGTVYEYLLRIQLQRDIPFATKWQSMPEQHYNMMNAAALSESGLTAKGERLRDELGSIISRLKRSRSKFIAGKPPAPSLLRSAMQLADYEMHVRGNVPFERFREPSRTQVKELARLVEATNWSLLQPTKRCLLNPTFGAEGCCPVDADADLLLDDMLIDIKTVSKLQVTSDYWYQLIGYAALNEHFPIGNGKRVPIRRVGIYFSRHAHLVSWSLKELVDRKRFTSFAAWLLKYASDTRHAQHRAKLHEPRERDRTTTTRKTAPKKASRKSR